MVLLFTAGVADVLAVFAGATVTTGTSASFDLILGAGFARDLAAFPVVGLGLAAAFELLSEQSRLITTPTHL